MIKKTIFLMVLALALPFGAFAGSSVDFTNSGGTLAGTNSGLTLTGSTLIAVNGLGGGLITGNNLGTVSFSTGVLTAALSRWVARLPRAARSVLLEMARVVFRPAQSSVVLSPGR